MKKSLLICLAAAGLAACSQPAEPVMTGADKDAHGCIGSAGYTWSFLENACIRIWEKGIALQPTTQEDAVFAAYVVLSADGTQAELFIPSISAPVLLDRSFDEQGPRWSKEGSAWLLKRLPQGWELSENGQVAYTAANPEQH